MKRQLALCVASLALCGGTFAQSGEREDTRPSAAEKAGQAAPPRCDRLTGAERRQCIKDASTGRKPQRADEHSGGGSSAPGGRADGEAGSYGARAPAKSGN